MALSNVVIPKLATPKFSTVAFKAPNVKISAPKVSGVSVKASNIRPATIKVAKGSGMP